MAQAVLEIRPKAKLAFGPPIENGFYYDFDLETPLTRKIFPISNANAKDHQGKAAV